MQSGSRCRAHSRGQSEDWAGAQSQNYCQVNPQNEQAYLQDHIWEPPNRRVSFHMPDGEDLVTESRDPSARLPIEDLELWLEYQADQLGTPIWWEELKAVPGVVDPCRFAQKIQASFYVPEI